METIIKRYMGRILVALTMASLCSETSAMEDPKGKENRGCLHGKVQVGVEGVLFKDVGPIVVFLDPVDKEHVMPIPADQVRVGIRKVGQKNATFDPEFVVTTVGQTLEFPNNDTILHNVFSYSKHNNFDLGLYPKGISKSVRFDHPGVVRIYCSIHQSMNGLIFVAPTTYHTIADAVGSFTICDVPVGRYRLITWNDRLPEASLDMTVGPGDMKDIVLVIGEKKVES